MFSVPAGLRAFFSDQRFFDPTIALKSMLRLCSADRNAGYVTSDMGKRGNPVFLDGSQRQVQFV